MYKNELLRDTLLKNELFLASLENSFFENESEYSNFFSWALNGSNIQQRMSSPQGKAFEVPQHWALLSEFIRSSPDDFPPTLKAFTEMLNF